MYYPWLARHLGNITLKFENVNSCLKEKDLIKLQREPRSAERHGTSIPFVKAHDDGSYIRPQKSDN